MKLQDMEAIQGPLVPMIFHGLNMYRHSKDAYLFGPTRYGGMEVTTFPVSTNAHRWEMLLDHLEQNDSMKRLFWASVGYT